LSSYAPEPAVLAHNDPAWLEFVAAHPSANAFHRPAWSEVLAATYGYPCSVLAQRDADGRIVAGLPVARVRQPFGRHRLVSLPFTDYCPLLADPHADVARFVTALSLWREDVAASVLEVRDELPAPGSLPQVVGTRHIVDLEGDSEAVFNRFDKGRIRNRINSAREQGVEAVLGSSREHLADFYRLHCLTRRRLGVPVQPWRFFENIFEKVIAPGLGFFVVAAFAGRPVAAALFLAWNRQLIYKFSASDRERWTRGANHLVLWTAMAWGCAAGYRSIDLGRTDAAHESLRVFKAGWRARELPLVYSHLGAAPRTAPSGLASRAMAQVIRRSPTVVCRTVGELLYRYAA
jgi:CelD/BcsL family acetyltransferase involved in cellulose biosynthesis